MTGNRTAGSAGGRAEKDLPHRHLAVRPTHPSWLTAPPPPGPRLRAATRQPRSHGAMGHGHPHDPATGPQELPARRLIPDGADPAP